MCPSDFSLQHLKLHLTGKRISEKIEGKCRGLLFSSTHLQLWEPLVEEFSDLIQMFLGQRCGDAENLADTWE